MRRVKHIAYGFACRGTQLLVSQRLASSGPLSDLTSVVFINMCAWNRLYQRFRSLWDFNLELGKTADRNCAKLPLVIC